jgi:Glyoxalase-like domain
LRQATGTIRCIAYTFQVAVDCRDPHVLADWWAEALGWEVEPQDEQFIRRMISEGHAIEADTTTHGGRLVWKDAAAISHPDGLGAAPRVLFQRVPEPKTVKNRVHLDLWVGGDAASDVVRRLTAGGATYVHEGHQGPHTWVTLTDPEGNEFCVSG